MPHKYTLTRDFLRRDDSDLLNIVRVQLSSPGCIHPLIEVIDDMELRRGYVFFVYQLLPVGQGHPHIFEVVMDRTQHLHECKLPFAGIQECRVLNVMLSSVRMVFERMRNASFIVHDTEFFDRIDPDEMEGAPSDHNSMVPVFMCKSLVGLHQPDPDRYNCRRYRKEEKQIMRLFFGTVFRRIHIHLDDKDHYIFHHPTHNPELAMNQEEEEGSDMKEESYLNDACPDIQDLLKRLTLTESDQKDYSDCKNSNRRNREEREALDPSKRLRRRRSSSGSASD